MLNKKQWFLFTAIIAGIFLRFYKIDWGNGLFPHPDERNIAGAISNLSFPEQMNPKFFAYGGFPIYLYYFTGLILDKIFSKEGWLSFDNFILIGRYWSAFFSSLSLILFYFLANKFVGRKLSTIGVFVLAFLPGVIQQAHFATVETLLSFFLIYLTILVLKYLEEGKRKYILFAAILAGLAIGTKISAFLFLPVIILAIFKRELIEIFKKYKLRSLTRFVFIILLSSFLSLSFFLITNPYVLLDYSSFRSTLNYESGVGLGNPVVFYTRQFQATTPVVFQFIHIFPYALGLPVLILTICGMLIFSYRAINKNGTFYRFVLITFYFALIPNLLFFTKWTRFVSPVFFFFVFFAIYFISVMEDKRRLLTKIMILVLCLSTLIWGLAFFSIYLRRDIRWTASDWMITNLKTGSHLLIETGNVIDIPLGGNFTKTSYDFFHIDENKKQAELFSEIKKADYFIIQSRRVWTNYTRIANTHPATAKFYEDLWSGKLGFIKIKEFDSFPAIFGIKINDELAEETFTVFDHPHISIWEKKNN